MWRLASTVWRFAIVPSPRLATTVCLLAPAANLEENHKSLPVQYMRRTRGEKLRLMRFWHHDCFLSTVAAFG
jgi:hypothetical protein